MSRAQLIMTLRMILIRGTPAALKAVSSSCSPMLPKEMSEVSSTAMGNAMGSLAEYWDLFRTIPQLNGGYIWEWCDHGIQTDKGFCYGGDFGEAFHDGNFCVDGIVTPDRKVTPKLLELKQKSPEIKLIPKIEALNRYLDMSIEDVQERIRKSPDGAPRDWETLNDLFLSQLL